MMSSSLALVGSLANPGVLCIFFYTLPRDIAFTDSPRNTMGCIPIPMPAATVGAHTIHYRPTSFLRQVRFKQP